jgi:hypothetical protein
MSVQDIAPATGVGDRAQYGVCAALALLGVVVIVDATRIGAATSSNDPVGPKALPFIIGAALVLISVFYALDVARGGVGEAEGGEDVELGAPRRLAHRRPSRRCLRAQRPAHRAARLGHQRSAAVRDVGLRARQPPPTPAAWPSGSS